MLALARPSVNEVWPLAANQNHRFNRPANDNNITSGLCTRTKWGYDTNTNDRRLLTIATTGAVARNFSYTGNAYQITGITDTAPGTHPWLSQTWSFTHDASDRLLTGNGTIAGNHAYGYDKLDNATSFAGVAGTYNNLNQISTFGGTAYTYDANGNLSSHGTRTYTYDAADRLKTVTQGTTTVTFAYDGLSRRLKQTVGATETRYLWCGAAICQQRSATDVYQKRFYAEGEYVHSGTKKYLTLTDHLGSVRDVIDITGTPTLVAAFDYRPYGATARSYGTVKTGYTYAGLFAQTNMTMLLSTTRAYNPANGKWLNVDPIREAGGINLTAYVNAAPTSATDSLGLKCSTLSYVTSCTFPGGGPSFKVPAEGDFPNGFIFGDEGLFHHNYDEPVPVQSSNPECGNALQQALINNPTAGTNYGPASPEGAVNDATPPPIPQYPVGYLPIPESPVHSYIRIDPLTGRVLIINITMPEHPLYPGYVMREVVPVPGGFIVHNRGEGNAWQQADWSPFSGAIKGVWKPQTEEIIARAKECGKC